MSKWRPTEKNCIYVIADIHGALDLVKKITDRIFPLRKSDGGKDKLIFLGDYIDRHVDSHKVLDYLIEIKKEYPDQIEFLMGNHELMLLQALDCVPEGLTHRTAPKSQEAVWNMWRENGGLETILGYMKRHWMATDDLIYLSKERLKDLIPAEHIHFLQELKKYHQIDNYLFVHGGINPYKKPEDQDLEVLVWDRSVLKFVLENIKAEKKELPWDQILVTGHNVMSNKQPIVADKFLMLDCGSPRQLLVTELQSMESYMAYPEQGRMVKFELKETELPKPIFKRVATAGSSNEKD